MKRVTLFGSNWDWLSWQSVLVALTLLQGYVLLAPLIWFGKRRMNCRQRTTKLPNCRLTTLLMIFITISTPIFYESERSFVPATACLYLVLSPCWECWCGDCSQALIVRRTRSFRLDNSPIRADVHRTGVGRLSLHYSSQITIYEASADPSSLVIMIIFIGFLIPVMLFYNLISTLSSWQSHEWSLWRVQLNMTQPVEPRAAPITTHHKWWVVYQSSGGVSPTPKALELGADSRRLIANSSGALARCLRSSHRQASFHHCNDRLFCFASITATVADFGTDCTQYRSPNCAEYQTSMPRVC